MNGRTSRLVAAVAVVALLTGTTPALALPAAADGFLAGVGGDLAGLWSVFTDFWKSGGGADPDGAPTETETISSGGGADPDGAPTDTGTTSSGGGADPDGVPAGSGG